MIFEIRNQKFDNCLKPYILISHILPIVLTLIYAYP